MAKRPLVDESTLPAAQRARIAKVRAQIPAIRAQIEAEKPELIAAGKVWMREADERASERRELLSILRLAREAAGLSLSDVAERAGLDKASLSRLETDELANPTLDTLQRYATAIGKVVRVELDDHAPMTGRRTKLVRAGE